MADDNEKLRALIRRMNAAPSASLLETEVRSQGAPNFKTEPDGEFSEKVATIAAWEWNYGVPQSDIKAFIQFLQEHEIELISLIEQIIPVPGDRLIQYCGTFIAVTGERGWYECRTIWSYRGDNPIGQWVDLLANAQFLLLFQGLRKRWVADPVASERLQSLLQLYTYDDDFVDQDDLDVAAGQRAIMNATAALQAMSPGN
jgi:hypothetical protein